MPTYDVPLTADGDLPAACYLVPSNTIEMALQRIRRRLLTHLGEYLLDRRVGLDYAGWSQQAPPEVEIIGAFIRREIETTPGVVAVESFRSSWDRATRTLSYAGDVLVGEQRAAFTVAPLGSTGMRVPWAVFVGPNGQNIGNAGGT